MPSGFGLGESFRIKDRVVFAYRQPLRRSDNCQHDVFTIVNKRILTYSESAMLCGVGVEGEFEAVADEEVC